MESFTIPKLSTYSHSKIKANLAMHYYMNGTSFARVEDSYLLNAFQICRPDVSLTSRKEIAGPLLEKCFHEVKGKVNKYMDSSPYLSITSDGWSNIKNEPIVNYMAVSASATLYLESVSTREMAHDAKFISEDIARVMKQNFKYDFLRCWGGNGQYQY
jgi:Protein of unknown function (DUF 659)